MSGRTGIIPATFADRHIGFRIPFKMQADQLISADESGVFFQDSAFLHNRDKPFEIWAMNIRLTAFFEDVALFPQPTFRDIGHRIRMTLEDTSKNENLSKGATRINNMVTSLQGDAGNWDWYVPYTLVRSEGFQIGLDADAFPAGEGAFDQVRVEISFEGYLDVIAPPSETR